MSIAQKNLRGLAPLAIALSLICLSPSAAAIEGGFDRTFGVHGQVNLTRKLIAFDMALQADGKILTASGIGHDGGEIARYNSDGTLDTSFADGGILDTQTAFLQTRIAVQSDGKIVFLTPDDGLGPVLGIVLKRYLANGQLDTSFGNGGTQRTPLPGFAFAQSLRIQADGKIVVLGQALGPGPREYGFGVVRYDVDGRLDTSFGNGGKVIATYDNIISPDEMVIQPDGKLLVLAAYLLFSGGSPQIVLVRFLPDGRLDTGFGSGGWQFASSIGGGTDQGIALQADGKILVAAPQNSLSSTVLRFLSDGRADDSFVSPPLEGRMSDVAVQADGRIIVAGRKDNPPPSKRTRGIVMRLNPDGSIDPDFQATTINYGGVNDRVTTTAIQPDGRILLFGGELLGDVNNSGLARVVAKTYCIADSFNPGRYLGFSDSGWFSAANSGRGGTGWGLVGRGRASVTRGPGGAWEWHSLLASSTSSPSYNVKGAARLYPNGANPGPGSALVIARGAAPVNYVIAERGVNQHNCSVRPGRSE